MRKFFKRLIFPIVGIAVSNLVFQAGNSGRVFSRWGDVVRPCVQDRINSFGCNWMFDVVPMLFAVLGGLIFFTMGCVRIFRFLRSSVEISGQTAGLEDEIKRGGIPGQRFPNM